MKDYLSQSDDSGLTCRDVTDRVSEYLDDRLSMSTKSLVGLHMASCVHCRTYMKQLRLVRDAGGFFPKPYPLTINRLHLRQYFVRCHSSHTVMS